MLIDANAYTVDIDLFQIVDEKRNLKQLSPPLILNYNIENLNVLFVLEKELMIN